jgi:hypothetical protein
MGTAFAFSSIPKIPQLVIFLFPYASICKSRGREATQVDVMSQTPQQAGLPEMSMKQFWRQ